MRPYDLAMVIVSVLLSVLPPQGFSAARERVIGQSDKQAVLVYLDRDAETASELWAFFWTSEQRCKGPDRAAVLITSERLAKASEAKVKAVAERGALAIQRMCGASFSRGAIKVLVAVPSVTVDANGHMQPPVNAWLTVEYREHGSSPAVSVTKYSNRQAPQQQASQAKEKGHTGGQPGQQKRAITELDQATGTQFTLVNVPDPCEPIFTKVRGDVPPHITLTPEATAVPLLEKGKDMALRRCPYAPSAINVELYQGNTLMASYTFARDSTPRYAFERGPRAHGGYYNKGASDLAQAQERQRKAEAQAARQAQEQQEAARREAEARRAREQQVAAQQEAQRRFDEFNRKNAIQEWPKSQQLLTNPFVHEGKTIGIHAVFQSMMTATQGLFDIIDGRMEVSDIPKGRLTTPGWMLIAGKVLGRTESGRLHLKFQDVYICQKPTCEDIRTPWVQN